MTMIAARGFSKNRRKTVALLANPPPLGPRHWLIDSASLKTLGSRDYTLWAVCDFNSRKCLSMIATPPPVAKGAARALERAIDQNGKPEIIECDRSNSEIMATIMQFAQRRSIAIKYAGSGSNNMSRIELMFHRYLSNKRIADHIDHELMIRRRSIIIV